MPKSLKIRLSPPQLDKREERAVLKILRSGEIAQGREVEKFERSFAEYIGVKYSVALNNGTSALVATLMALDIEPGDEVITTSFTFGATANCILAVGAKVKFADIDAVTYTVAPKEIERLITKRTKAFIAVDLFGHCADWLNLLEIARLKKLIAIEDAAQAHGALIGKKMAGSFGSAATFSFYATKNLTTAEGGMVTTNDEDVYKQLLCIRNHGMTKKYHYQTLGFNFRLTNIQAAIGRVQLAKLRDLNRQRVRHANYLTERLKNTRGIVSPAIKPGTTHVFHQYVIRVTEEFTLSRDRLAIKLYDRGIETGIHYPVPLHKFPLYNHDSMLPRLRVSEQISSEVLSLPIHPALSINDLDYIVNCIQSLT